MECGFDFKRVISKMLCSYYFHEHLQCFVIEWMAQDPTDAKLSSVRWLLGAVRQRAIIWPDIDPGLWRHMTSLYEAAMS